MSSVLFYAYWFDDLLDVALILFGLFGLFWLIRRLKIGFRELKIPLSLSIILSISTSTYEYIELTNSIIQQPPIYKTLAVSGLITASFLVVFIFYFIIRWISFLHDVKNQYGSNKRNIELDCSAEDVFEAFRKFSLLKFEVFSLDETKGVIILKTSSSDWSLGEILKLTVTPSAKRCSVNIEASRKIPTNFAADLYSPVDKIVNYLRETLEMKKLNV